VPPADAGPAFGALLRRHRQVAGLTQEALAERAGLSARTVQSLEGGGTRPYRDSAERLIGALGLAEEERAALRAAAGGQRRTRADSSPAGSRPPRGPGPAPSNLPAPRTALIGREQEVARVREALAGGTTRLLTVTGVGGAGKTSVACRRRGSCGTRPARRSRMGCGWWTTASTC
jgi:transcriptional regulator with XRE-family HTH domain